MNGLNLKTAFIGFFIATSWLSQANLYFALAILLVLFIFDVLLKGKPVKFHFILLPILLWIIFAFPGSYYNNDLSFFIKILITPLLVLFICSNLVLTRGQLKLVMRIALAVFFIISMIMFFQVDYRVFNFNILDSISRSRFHGYYLVSKEPLGPNLFAIYLALSVLTAYILFISSESKYRIGYFLILLTTGYLLLTIASRNLIVALVIIFIVNQFIEQHKIGFVDFSKRAAKLSLVGLVLIFVTLPFLSDEIFERFEVISTMTADQSLLTRFHLWGASIDSFLASPFTGNGYSYIYNLHNMTSHNEFLSHLSGGGLFSGIMFLVTYLSLFFIAKSKLYSVDKEHFFYARYTFSLLFLTLSFGFTEAYSFGMNVTFYPLIWLFFGMLLSINPGKSI
jgi:O-antigen ligase